MKQIKGLDTLRAFAVFFVLIEHYGVWFDTTVPNGKFIKDVIIPDGGFGVFLFFVLSGFLITSILLNEKKRGENNKERLVIIKNFFLRRALRIFPIYYLLIFLLYFINYPDIHQHLIYFITYTTNILCYRTNSWNAFSHTWTLSIEEQFYLLWPWLILFVNNKYIKYVFIVAILTGIVSTYICMEIKGHMAPLLVINCFDAFGIGGLYAYARLDNSRCKKIERTIKVLALVSLFIYFYDKIAIFANCPTLHGFYIFKIINCILAVWLIMLVVNNNKSAIVREYFLENRFLNYIGKISYGIYLYHYVYNNWFYTPVYNFLKRITMPHPILYAAITDSHYFYWIYMAIIVLISSISYFLIEKPFLSLKKFFKYNS